MCVCFFASQIRDGEEHRNVENMIYLSRAHIRVTLLL